MTVQQLAHHLFTSMQLCMQSDVHFRFTVCNNIPCTVVCVNVQDIVKNVILYVPGKAQNLTVLAGSQACQAISRSSRRVAEERGPTPRPHSTGCML